MLFFFLLLFGFGRGQVRGGEWKVGVKKVRLTVVEQSDDWLSVDLTGMLLSLFLLVGSELRLVVTANVWIWMLPWVTVRNVLLKIQGTNQSNDSTVTNQKPKFFTVNRTVSKTLNGMWQQWIITLQLIPSDSSLLSHRLAYLCWAPPSYTGLDRQWVQHQVVIRSSAFWFKKKKKLRQDFSMSPVVQYSDLSWSPWLHTTTEGSVSHHNSFHLEPVGKNARKANSNLLVIQEGREAGRPANREGTQVCQM